MEWLDFSNTSFIIAFIIVAVCLALIIVVIFILIISYNNERNSRKELYSESNTMRVFVVNPKSNKVIYFDRRELSKKKTITMQAFYSRFSQGDVSKIKSWFTSILNNNEDCPQFLEVDTMISKSRKRMFTLLKLVDSDSKTGAIHIESHLLKYVTLNSIRRSRRSNNATSGIVKKATMRKIIEKGKTTYGYTFDIRFFYLQQSSLIEENIEKLISITLKNVLYQYIHDKVKVRQAIDESDNEMIIFDLKMSNKADAMKFATNISHSLKRTIEINGFDEKVSFAIGICENSLFYQDFDKILKYAQEALMSAIQNNEKIVFYKKSALNDTSRELIRENIEKLFMPQSIRYLFRPIINVSKGEVIGYFEYPKTYSMPFSNFIEMSKYTEKEEMNGEFLAHVARNVISRFNYQKPSKNSRLFFSISMCDIGNIEAIFSQISEMRENRVVLTFEEEEVNLNGSEVELLRQAFLDLKNLGFELALSMLDKDLLLDPSIYYLFDYFVIGSSMIGEIKKNNKIRLSIHTLIESLLTYHRPIIVSDLEGWQSIELVIKSGINYVSSETISQASDMILPVESKKIMKLSQINETFH